MKSNGVSPNQERPAVRAYNSPLRDKQADDTRRLILDAAATELARSGLRDTSIGKIAELAGVSARTVYRHFPTHEALIEALSEWANDAAAPLPYPQTLDELPVTVGPLFRAFDERKALVRALLLTNTGRELRARNVKHRSERLKRLLKSACLELDGEDGLRTRALLHYLFSAHAWQWMQDTYGLSGESAAQAVAWALNVLINDLKRQRKRK
jgi:AcrR family transcriptional regulator